MVQRVSDHMSGGLLFPLPGRGSRYGSPAGSGRLVAIPTSPHASMLVRSTGAIPQLTQLHRHSRGTARWSPGKPGNPLRQPRGWPPTGICWPTSMIHCSSSGARGQPRPNPVALMLPGNSRPGPVTLHPAADGADRATLFRAVSLSRNNDDHWTQKRREKRERPRIMGEAEGPEWHDANRDTPGKKVEPGSQQVDRAEAPGGDGPAR